MTARPDISPMTRDDIPALVELEKQCFSKPWTYEGFAAELENSAAHFLTAKLGGNIVGYIGFQAVLDEGYVDNVAVSPECRRQGIAKALLTEAIEESKRMGLAFLSLEVRQSNAPAIALYKSFGFETVGVRKRFYTAPTEDADIMTIYFNV